MGLNSTILICYLWVALCLPFTKIKDYLKTFFGKEISTSGLSRHVIRVSKIMKAVYDEILGDINNAVTLHADETGWTMDGKKAYAWLFANDLFQVFAFRETRGSKVPKEILGEEKSDLILVVDRYRGYSPLLLLRQFCYAHLLRDVEKLKT